MIIQVSIVLGGAVDRNWRFDNAHENDDHRVVKTLVAVNNSPTQDYNGHSPEKHIPLSWNIIDNQNYH